MAGTVQGVGFRPYVYRLVGELDLDGWVLNDTQGVLLEVEGDEPAVEAFLARLAPEAPPLAVVERVLPEERPPTGERGFAIRPSPAAGEPLALVSPDTATCADCLHELFDPADRRFRYPFVNCTNCGPRFTIVRGVPYDRPLTTMAGFEMCDVCRAEYDDPSDRRFHAQPNACSACGPAARLTDAAGAPVARDSAPDAVAATAAALRGGAIVAIKGLGGYHLACRADDENAVATLRARKHREDKPFALMAADVGAVRELVELAPDEEPLLSAPARPIVLAPRLRGAPVADAVAPRAPELGLMLPYSPLHHLLLADTGANLVLTSGNVSDEPIAYRDDEALERLGAIADLFLIHDRPIHMRTDDSVARTVAVGAGRKPVLLRRSRGYVPASLDLPIEAPAHVLACGAEQKSTFCVAKGRRAWVGHHIGDLRSWETLRSFTEGIEHFERLFAVEPAIVAHDLHPEYLSTKYATEREGAGLEGVQHHHAHLAACLAEHGEPGPAVGAIYDGTGYGADGTVWGGELLIGDLAGFERVGHLRTARMPGGEQAIREPWRMACAWLVAAGEDEPALPAPIAEEVTVEHWRAISELARTGLSAPETSSMGRLFDAVAALCGVCARINYEGQAAIELEAAAVGEPAAAYPLPVSADGVLDPRPTVQAVLRDVSRGATPGGVSARFHAAVAEATALACARVCSERGIETVALSGGVFQNRLLLERTAALLRAAGLRVLVPERLPSNDGGIAYGQVAVAIARSAS